MSKSDPTHSLLEAVQPGAPDQLLPLVYSELRKLAAAKLAHEQPGQKVQATALVHEAYLRLVRSAGHDLFNSPGHFFSAAAEAMRRILVENARRRDRLKHGGGREQQALELANLVVPEVSENLLALDEALGRLALKDPESAELVKLRYFAGLTVPEAAKVLGISPRKVNFLWSSTKAWLRREIESET